MENVLIELRVPAAQASCDMFIPRASMIYDVIQLIKAGVSDMFEGEYAPTDDTLLCDETGKPIDINMRVEDAGIRNGTCLMLI